MKTIYRFCLSQLKANENDNDNAIHCLEMAIEIKNDEPEWHKKLATLANIENNSAGEIAHLRKALEVTHKIADWFSN